MDTMMLETTSASDKSQITRMLGRMHDYQIVFDAHEHGLRTIRAEMDAKQDRAENSRLFDTVATLQRKVVDLENQLNRKVESEDLSDQMKDVVNSLGKKSDGLYLDDKIRLLRSELHADLALRPARSDINAWLTGKADVTEMDGLFERAQQNTQAAKLQMESALIAKIGDIKEGFAQLQHSLTRELEDLHGIVREQVEERLSGLKGELEDHMQDRLNAMMKHEKDQRNEATRTMQETVQNNIAAAVGSVGATEATARLHVEESLRAEFSAQFTNMSERLGSEMHATLKTRAGAQDVKTELKRLSESLSEKIDSVSRGEMVPALAELRLQLSQKADAQDVRAWMDSKAECTDLQRATGAAAESSRAMMDRFEHGLSKEGEARRKGLAGLQGELSAELAAFGRHRDQRTEEDTGTFLQEMRTKLKTFEQTMHADELARKKTLAEGAEMKRACAEVAKGLTALEGHTRGLLDTHTREIEQVRVTSIATRAEWVDEMQRVKSEVDQQLRQVGAGAIEELLEDREKRYAELAAVHEGLRMLEDGRLTMIDRNLIAKKEAIEKLERSLEESQQTAAAAVKSSMDAMNAKLAWCVEQLQTFVEDDLGKQHIATKRLRSDLDTRLSTLTKLTTSELERVHVELDRRLQQPGVHMERLEKRLEAEGRGREEQLEHICSELGIVQGLEDRLAKGLNDFEERVTARLGTLGTRIAEEHCHSQQHESEMKEKLKLEAHTRQQTLVQLSAGVQAEIEATMEDTAKKLETAFAKKVQEEQETRQLEIKRMERDTRAQLLDMMCKLSGVVQEDATSKSRQVPKVLAPISSPHDNQHRHVYNRRSSNFEQVAKREISFEGPNLSPPRETLPLAKSPYRENLPSNRENLPPYEENLQPYRHNSQLKRENSPPRALASDLTSPEVAATKLHSCAAYASGYAAGFGWTPVHSEDEGI